MIDTHCHLNFDAFDADRDMVVAHAVSSGVRRIIIPAVDKKSADEAQQLTEHYSGVYSAVGVHPNSTADFTASDLLWIEAAARHNKVVAIGEIGLDYHWDTTPRTVQRRAFEQQLELAGQLELPVIIHNREAHEDVMAILESWAAALPPTLHGRAGVLHSFSAPSKIADRALAAGFYLGFTGPITYKNADDLRRTAARIPLDRLLVETDAPYLTPHPYRGKRNDPSYIPLIIERLAALHVKDELEMARITTENAERLFRLPVESSS